MTPADRIEGLEMALQVIRERLAIEPSSARFTRAKVVIEADLARAKALEASWTLKQIAAEKGVTYEAVRARYRRICPKAEANSRIIVPPEIAAQLLGI